MRSGGHLVVTYFSGIVDENDHIRLGSYPGAFSDLLGVRMEEFFPLRAGESLRLSTFGAGSRWSELGGGNAPPRCSPPWTQARSPARPR